MKFPGRSRIAMLSGSWLVIAARVVLLLAVNVVATPSGENAGGTEDSTRTIFNKRAARPAERDNLGSLFEDYWNYLLAAFPYLCDKRW